MGFGDADGAIHLMTAGGDDEPGMLKNYYLLPWLKTGIQIMSQHSTALKGNPLIGLTRRSNYPTFNGQTRRD